MKKIKIVSAIALAMLAAAALLVSAQDPGTSTGTSKESVPSGKTAPAKKPAKKKAVKKTRKRPPPPASEYRFDKIDSIPSYRFDKKANPIMKDVKPGKKPAKAAKGGNAAAKTGATPQGRKKSTVKGGGQRQQQDDRNRRAGQGDK